MKNTFKLVLLASLVVFAAACGKKNESGGSSGSSFSSLSNGIDLSRSSNEALKNFDRWYRGREEGSRLMNGAGNYALTYQSSLANGGSPGTDCEEDSWGPFVWYTCSGSTTTTGSSTGNDCKVTVGAYSNNSIKNQNDTLADMLSGQYGTLVNATQSGATGSVIGPIYTLQFQQQSGSVISFVIDTNYHSAFQPVQVSDYETGGVEILRAINYIYNGPAAANLPSCHQ